MTAVLIPHALLEALQAHAERTYPHECCGALLGTAEPEGWRIAQSIPTANSAGPATRTRYEIAPAEVARIYGLARNAGLEIAGFYHSHPDHASAPSAADLAEAHWLGCCYLIVEVRPGRPPSTAAWLLAGSREENKHFQPQQIRVL